MGFAVFIYFSGLAFCNHLRDPGTRRHRGAVNVLRAGNMPGLARGIATT